MKAWEVNFDGIVGPTHNYAGLSFGNVASSSHGGQSSSPRQAALQGLEKAWALTQMDLKQGIVPPQERPHIPTLRNLGFSGSETEVLGQVAKESPQLLAATSSASCMWVANAATISPFADTRDGKTHMTPANLSSMFHRSIEPPTTSRVFQAMFNQDSFVHHAPLPAGPSFSDEGAANHTRFCNEYGEPGVALFVYGDDLVDKGAGPKKFPARQTLPACKAIARSHGLSHEKVVYARQNPAAIDAGVFHNDVIAVGNQGLLFHHELAFAKRDEVYSQLDAAMGRALDYIEVPSTKVSLSDAVRSYLFNSQLLSVPGKSGATLIVPGECEEVAAVHEYLQWLESESALINEVCYFNLRQSMNNGGGPACLRLRVVMSEDQIANTAPRILLDEALYSELRAWVERNYRDSLAAADLQDPALLSECRTALDELTQLLKIGSVYDFQL
ncbi:MAG: N-succinylarginine dihydrolase [Pseudomonadales bacterium]|nr:N-succinylarginine dihydrolase [Pseudomonadales bacterium]MBL6817076.1 N-succinylarginine dihydrolase [Pseudomonadales bacterium]MCH1599571.1 N-succinylarginine dihydrolase [Pseudomonadales bacterium]